MSVDLAPEARDSASAQTSSELQATSEPQTSEPQTSPPKTAWLAKLSPRQFSLGLTTLFFAFGLLGIVNHEMWRDEYRAWAIARTSVDIPQLLHTVSFEGTPPLWHLCLWVITAFTNQPFAMQLFHLTVVSGAIFLMARFSPFTAVQKLLLAFGYFPFYEYGIISRSYGLTTFFLFVVAAACSGHRRYKLLAVLLPLLASTTVFGAIMAFSIGLGLLVEYFDFKSKRLSVPTQGTKRAWLIGCIALLVSGVAFAGLMKPPSNAYTGDWQYFATSFFQNTDPTLWRLAKGVSRILCAYLPIPEIKLTNWSTTIFSDNKPWISLWMASGVLLFWSVFDMLKDRMSRTTYSVGTIGMVAFTFLFWLGTTRHYGQLFMLLIVSLWVAIDYQKSQSQKTIIDSKFTNYVIVSVLFVHFLMGLYFYLRDLREVFSPIKLVGEFVKKHDLTETPMFVIPDVCATGIATLTDGPVYSFADPKLQLKFERLDIPAPKNKWNIVALRSLQYAHKWNQPVLVLSNKRLGAVPKGFPFKEVGRFTSRQGYEESRYLYVAAPTDAWLQKHNL